MNRSSGWANKCKAIQRSDLFTLEAISDKVPIYILHLSENMQIENSKSLSEVVNIETEVGLETSAIRRAGEELIASRDGASKHVEHANIRHLLKYSCY